MHASELRRSSCPKEILSEQEESFYRVLKRAFRMAVLAAARGEGSEGILSQAKKVLEEGYQPSMFAYPWMAQSRTADDAQKRGHRRSRSRFRTRSLTQSFVRGWKKTLSFQMRTKESSLASGR